MSIFSNYRNLIKSLGAIGNKQQVTYETTRLEQSLSSIETWSFGLTGHVGWVGTAPVIHAAIGSKALFLWLPIVIVSFMLNLQVQSLGKHWSNVAGGTPNYAARLLKNVPGLGRYVAIGYYIGRIAVPAVYAIVLTDSIETNLEPLGIHCPKTILRIGFAAIAYIVGLSGTRALSILHLFFVIPAALFLLAFCFQGLGWLAFSPNSPGLFPSQLLVPSFSEWAKWFLVATYTGYGCETASSFVADSEKPAQTLRFLTIAAWLSIPILLGGSWVIMQLAQPTMGNNLYLILLASAQPFWGQSASFLVTLLIAFCCLLSCATTVANTPRILYQLSLDGYLSPVFAVVSRRGVLGPALTLSFVFSLLCLAWGNLDSLLMVTGVSYLISIMGLHLGLWVNRGRPQVRWAWWSLVFFIVEAIVLIVGGLAWSWQDLLCGLLLPIVILSVDAGICRIPFAPFHPDWWKGLYCAKSNTKIQDFVVLQVSILIFLICGATTIGWSFRESLDHDNIKSSGAIFVIVLVTMAFVGVAIACWTSLPQVAAIDEARQQAENLFLNALDAILVVDDRGAIAQANPAAAVLFHKTSESLVGYHLQEFFSTLTGSVDEWQERSEQTLIESDERCRILEACISMGWNPRSINQQSHEYIVILRDITERKQAQKLRQSEERYALAVQGANDGLWDWNLTTDEVYFSQRWKSMLGYEDHEIKTVADEWFNRIHTDDVEQFKLEFSKHLEGRTANFEHEHRVLHKDGTYRWMLTRGLAVRDEAGKPLRVAGSQTDITDRRRAEEQLSYDALHDSLTGLSNRVLFRDRLEHVLLAAKRRINYTFAVLFIDLDRFKVINDSLGHLAGDQLLIGIAQRLRVCIRTSDTFARLGGDEFAILIEDIYNKSDIIHLVERLLEEFKLPFNLNGHEVFAAASIGVLLDTADYERSEDLLRDADTAMYRAKERGRGCYEVFDMTMRDRAIAMLHLETDLRKALEKQEFQLHYQPIVSLKTNQITGFEALVRWQHPGRGLVSPVEFIPLAEETGLIIPLGCWVLREACSQMQAWQVQFPENSSLTISVNISGKQFAQTDLVAQIKRTLYETGLDPHNLKLEITESTIVEDIDSAKTKLSQLKALGVEVSIDDFGTGYCSLAYLNRFPVDTLKIDRSFIKDLDINPERLEIIRAIVTLADNLGIDIVAEGVETKAQLSQLCSLKPTSQQEYFVQGYLFSKPLNRDAATVLLASCWDDQMEDFPFGEIAH